MKCWAAYQGARQGCSLRYLESLVCIEIQWHSGIREEEMQSPKVQQVIAADLSCKCLHSPWILHWVQQHYLQIKAMEVT